ncbi:MAG: hypothetical protein ACRCY4_06240 [Brevinema sp.]
MTILELEHLHTVPVLRTISSTWRTFTSFQAEFLKFPDSHLLLNFLVFNESTLLDDVVNNLADMQDNDHSHKDLALMLQVWNSPLSSKSLQTCINAWENDIQLSSEKIFNFDLYLNQLYQSSIDPLVQVYGFLHRTWEVTQNHPAQERIMRILMLLFLKELKILKEPIFYPDNFLILGHLFQAFPNPVTEDAIIIYLHQFEKICVLGRVIIEISTQKIKKLIETMRSKLDDDPDVQFLLCSHLIIEITQLMKTSNWKRDKAARFLNQLSLEGIFFQKKIGTQKFFINAGLLDIFMEIKNSPQIQKMMVPSV